MGKEAIDYIVENVVGPRDKTFEITVFFLRVSIKACMCGTVILISVGGRQAVESTAASARVGRSTRLRSLWAFPLEAAVTCRDTSAVILPKNIINNTLHPMRTHISYQLRTKHRTRIRRKLQGATSEQVDRNFFGLLNSAIFGLWTSLGSAMLY